jgi:hypothetical protein
MNHANVDGPVFDVAGPFVFRKEGEYWTLAYAGPVFRLRHVKGMSYLAHLLGRPGERFPAAELLSATAQGSEDGDRRVNQRPGTRNQKPSGERARLLVTQRIKAALKKVQNHNPSLGHHLSTCVRTGHLCAYVPDPGRPIEWVV